MRVIAFDPGFERLGVAILERTQGKDVLLHSTCIQTSKTLSFHERLHALGEAVATLMLEWKPNRAALEDVFFANNAKTAMKVAEVRGMLLYLAMQHKLAVYEYTPLQVKIGVTGYGKSDKKAVAFMVPKLLALPPKKRLDDELDAIAVGLTCLANTRIAY